MIYLVKDYDRIKEAWQDILDERPTPDGQPKGNQTGNPTYSIAAKREVLFRQMEAVEQAMLMIPEEYRRGVVNHVKYQIRFPDYADKNTWFAWQAKFLYYIAARLNEI